MVNIPRQAPGTTIMSYSASSTSTSASASTTAAGTVSNSSPSTPSSSLYLFTFLITIVVLGLISGALLFRAYYMRRQFHRRVEEAIRSGRPIPTEAAHALGLGGFGSVAGPGRRGKKDKKVGPMPSLWEVGMFRDGEKWDRDDEPGVKDWDELTPLSISHYSTIEASNPDNTNFTQLYLPPAPPSPTNYIRSLLTSHRRADIYNIGNTISRPALPRTGTAQSIPQSRTAAAYAIPEEGEDVVVGVIIAMPVQGPAEERWNLQDREDDEEREVPEVCLGVVSTRIAKNKYSESDE